jgi:hypothetical protein
VKSFGAPEPAREGQETPQVLQLWVQFSSVTAAVLTGVFASEALSLEFVFLIGILYRPEFFAFFCEGLPPLLIL